MFNTMKYLRPEEVQGEIPDFKEISKHVMKIVWPSMLEAFLVALVIMLDGIMIAWLVGESANTGVSLVKQLVFTQSSLIMVVSICITAIIARRRGQNEPQKANKAMHQGLQVGIILSIAVAIIFGGFSEQLTRLMASSNPSDDVISLGATYLRIMSFGFIFNAIRIIINTGQRSIGNTKISLYTNLIANICNISMNFLFMPSFGVAGCALATILSNAIAMIISICAILPKKNFLAFNINYLIKFDKETFDVFKKLVPGAFFEQMMMRLGFIILALIVNNLGEEATYVNGICTDINSMMFTLADGFGIGTSAIIGRKLGEGRKDHAIVYSRVSMMLSLTIALFVGFIMFFCRPFLISLYRPESESTIILAQQVMMIATLTIIPQNIQWVITGILRGSGDTKFTAFTSFISIVVCRPIITFVLCYVLGFGLFGSWWGMFADQLIRCCANMWRYKSRVWLKIKV